LTTNIRKNRCIIDFFARQLKKTAFCLISQIYQQRLRKNYECHFQVLQAIRKEEFVLLTNLCHP